MYTDTFQALLMVIGGIILMALGEYSKVLKRLNQKNLTTGIKKSQILMFVVPR